MLWRWRRHHEHFAFWRSEPVQVDYRLCAAASAARPDGVYLHRRFTPLLARAEDRFAEYPFLQYRLLDIDKEPDEQGFRGDMFDIVIASNVLHATVDLRQTMLRVSDLTAPGGLL